jgi:hypothetical protein
MANELSGLGGYASLMKTQKNPYERNIATTNAVMNQMPQNGGVSGLEGLGKIPLMYQQGVDSANARQFDEARAVEDQKTMQGVQAYQQQKDAQDQKAQALKTAIELSKTDFKAANDLLAQSLPEMASKVKFSGNDKDGWKDIEVKGPDGFTTRGYLNPAHFAELAEAKKNGTLDEKTTQEIFNRNFSPFSRYETKEVNKSPEITSNIVQDPESKTGWSYVGKDGQIIAKNAEPPKKPAGNGNGSGNNDRKEFRTWVSQLDGLYRNRASIEKGLDPLTGAVIPQQQIDTAKATINREIQSKEQFISTEFPDQWKSYRIPDVKGDTIPSHGPSMPKARPQQASQAEAQKTIGGVTYFKRNGQWYTQ